MINSMTGYGRGERVYTHKAYLVEVQSFNHRFFELRTRMPRHLSRLEPYIYHEVRRCFSRGRFDVYVGEKDIGERTKQTIFNLDLAHHYYKALKEIKDELGIPGDITLDLIVKMKDFLPREEEEDMVEEAWQEVSPALVEALESLGAMRAREGAVLKTEIEARLDRIADLLNSIEERSPQVVMAYRDRLRTRVLALLEGHSIDISRLEQEVTIFADRSEISEECVRLRSHLGQFQKTIEGPGPQGRKLDFLLQEMTREANTISGKAQDAIISQQVVEIRAELEKIREQVQNIE